MSKEDRQDKFTKIATDLLLGTRDLVNWGFETGNTTPEKMRHSISSRWEIIPKMIAAGMKQPAIAKALNVSQSTISLDLKAMNLSSKNDEKFITRATRTREANQQKRKAALHAPAKPVPDLHQGDFRELSHKIPDDSVQLIFTDPPYDQQSIPLYRDAASIAARILKPGGSFMAYTGHQQLPDVLSACGHFLRYWWIIACVHGGPERMLDKLGLRAGWKPMIWYVKGTRGDVQNVICDTVIGTREKDDHEWQQAQSEAEYFIEKLTTQDQIVVDFFSGSGTTKAAAHKLGRRCIAFEVNKLTHDNSVVRLKQA